MSNRQQLFLDGSEGSKEHVILIASLTVLSPLRHHPDYSERQFAHTHGLSDRICSGKEVFSYGTSNNHYPRGSTDIGIREEFTALNFPFTDLRKLFVNSLELAVPVLVAEN